LPPSSDNLFSAAADTELTADSVTELRVCGEVTRVLFEKEDGSYAVVRVVDPDDREWVLVGAIGGIAEGQDIEAVGTRAVHKEYGEQLKVREFRAVLPTNVEGIRRYLGSGVIPGIGPKIADKIVGHFGTETLTIIDRYSARLTEVDGIGKSKLDKIRQAWSDQSERRDVYVFLQGLGISPAYCDRIYRQYKQESPQVVRDNPYRLASEVRGIGFRMADGIASRLHIAKDNPFRLASGLLYVLGQLADQGGHSCFPKTALIEKSAEMLQVDIAVAEQGLDRAKLDAAVIEDAAGCELGNELIYRRDLYNAECTVSSEIRRMLEQPALPADIRSLPQNPRWATLNKAQQQAVMAAFQNTISIITGGPGVGKTTVTREVVAHAKCLQLKVVLAAPTGRAAKRLSESCRAHAQTIHRLLKWQPETGGFFYNGAKRLPAAIVIIDEVSMLDIRLAESLFQAIAPGTRVVLVGDRDQLPSVGPGSVLGDLIGSARVAVTHLTEVYRQSENSHIITSAHAVNGGRFPQAPRMPKGQLTDYYFIEQDDPEKALQTIRTMVQERIPSAFKFDPMRDVQVLSPMNKGTCGAESLNAALQEALNPRGQQNWAQFESRGSTFRVGDRVMQTSNNYDLQVFNGDLGRIVHIDGSSKSFRVQYDTGVAEYRQEDAVQLRLAYAITIHKSQGSEFPVVIVPMLNQHYVMLQRNLLYTAMTRAKQLLIVVGGARAVNLAVRNVNQSPRFSHLRWRLVQQ
jgi:exodeoxyribonuclease V alpha subunit